MTSPAKDRAGHTPAEWAHLVALDSPTEERNPRSADIDLLPTEAVISLIIDEDRGVADAVATHADRIAAAVDLAVEALQAGGRVHYAGSGTSGRLGVLDAVELLPTYGVNSEWFDAHLAGGRDAMLVSQEGAEDDPALARRDLGHLGKHDLVVGLAASGRTPYVRGALELAREHGCPTVLISANPRAPLAELADVAILVNTGPEVITGSTRMKAATAQKLVLNTLSTATMVRMGRTYSNLMVDVRATNDKLRARTVRMLHQASGLPAAQCWQALSDAEGEVAVALVGLLTGQDASVARDALAWADAHPADRPEGGSRLRRAVAHLGESARQSAGE